MIDPVHTACKKCVFAIYEGITQTGCSLNYIEKYKKNNVDILDAYDEENEFYVVNKKKCIGYREPSYFNNKEKVESVQEKIDYFYNNNHIQYLLIINLYDFEKNSLDELAKQIKILDIQPEKIIFIRYNYLSKIFTYDTIKDFLEKSEYSGVWRIQTMVDNQLSYEDILHNCINLNKSFRFMVSISSPNKELKNLNNIVNTANKIVYKDLGSFTILSTEKKEIILFSTGQYRYSFLVNKENIINQDKYYTFI
jgi:hypothetical protein